MLARSVVVAARPVAGLQAEMPVPATPIPWLSYSVSSVGGIEVNAHDVRTFFG